MMDYDVRSRLGLTHDAQRAMHRAAATSSPVTHHMYGRESQSQQNSNSSSPGLGIRVAIKPEYGITPPPHKLQHAGDIPRSNFQFDFGLERKVLAEADRESPNWSKFGMEKFPTKVAESSSPKASVSDPIVNKYIAMGHSREAVPIAVANYGDNPAKVGEFVNGYTLLREMGFSSIRVAEGLVAHDNNTDKALAHFLSRSP